MIRIIQFILLLPILSISQIQINEIFADNGSCCLDDSLETEDFIEIINMSQAPIDVAGYFFGDGNSGSIIPSGFPEITTINGGGLLLLWFDEDPEQGPLHIDAKLSSGGESIIAVSEQGDTIFNILYPPQIEDVSYASIPDGSNYDNNWLLSLCPTPGEPNSDCPLIEGCTSSNASNYNVLASIEDGSCIFEYQPSLMINEYSASNCDLNGNYCGDYEDWIEIYNNSDEPIDLAGYFVSDKVDNTTKWQFNSSTVINPGSYYVLYASGLNPNIDVNNTNTSFKLTQTRNNEYVVLSSPDQEIIDYVKLKRHQLNHSWGRDASFTWVLFEESTQGSDNLNPFTDYTAKPEINLSSGFYNNSIDVALSCSSPNSDIFYTLDGSFPTQNSFYYGSTDVDGTIDSGLSINISETTVLRTVSFSQNPSYLPSFCETNTYFINTEHTVDVISISGDEVDDLINGDYGNRPVGTIEYFDVDGNLVDEAVGEFNKHGNDSWAYDQRGLDYITRDQYGYNYAINDKIFTTKNRDSFQRLILKAAANDNYPATFGSPAHIRDSYVHSLSQIGDLRMDERSHESCILYVNGEYWGVYDVREKVDDIDFLEYYYDQGEGYVDFLKTWGNTWVEFGNNATYDEWENLVDFIVDNDMSDEDNYEYVKSVYNTGSLIDYFILNSYVVAMDWLNWNTGWWRGRNPDGDKKKWRYILWDMDATFDHYVNYTGVPDTSSDADPCDPEELGDPGGQGHVPILNSLFDNENFTADYINRYADLSNTIFSCDFMINHLDSLINIIDPEMPAQINRWGGSYDQWQSNVQELRDFILERCSDEFVEGMEECYDVQAIDVTLIIEGEGEVSVNTVDLIPADSPWTGTYYSGLPIELEANPIGDNLSSFYWELVVGDIVIENPSDPSLVFDLNEPVTIIANFNACLSVATEEIVGPTQVESGSIWQYTFPSLFTNTSEWEVAGGEIIFTSSSENTIGVQWNYGTGVGQIVLTQYNEQGELECLFVNIDIQEVEPTSLADGSDLNFVLYPNPASDNLFVYFNSSNNLKSVRVFDMSGKMIKSLDPETFNKTIKINLSSFSSGLYYLQCVGIGNIKNKPFQVK